MTERTLLPGEYAVLCMLALRPMHGYEMMCFLADEGLDAVCPVEQSTLYTYLRNVESRELVSWTEVRVGLRPPRKTYTLSTTGQHLVNDWLRQPVLRMREVRLEFLLKLFFLDLIDRPAVSALLSAQVAVCEQYLRLIGATEPASPFRRLVARSRASAAEGTLTWLRDYARDLAAVPQ